MSINAWGDDELRYCRHQKSAYFSVLHLNIRARFLNFGTSIINIERMLDDNDASVWDIILGEKQVYGVGFSKISHLRDHAHNLFKFI